MEDRPTISSSRLGASDVARATFSPARRGYDPREVRSYLEQVARELSNAEQRIADFHERQPKMQARMPVARRRQCRERIEQGHGGVSQTGRVDHQGGGL